MPRRFDDLHRQSPAAVQLVTVLQYQIDRYRSEGNLLDPYGPFEDLHKIVVQRAYQFHGARSLQYLRGVGIRSYLEARYLFLEKGGGAAVVIVRVCQKEIPQGVRFAQIHFEVFQVVRPHGRHPRVKEDGSRACQEEGGY